MWASSRNATLDNALSLITPREDEMTLRLKLQRILNISESSENKKARAPREISVKC